MHNFARGGEVKILNGCLAVEIGTQHPVPIPRGARPNYMTNKTFSAVLTPSGFKTLTGLFMNNMQYP